MGKKQILVEYFQLESLTEAKRADDGFVYLKGLLQHANKKNGNGRVYQESALKREVENYRKIVRERRAYGELDHPDSSVVELKNASHLITEINMEGEGVYGTLKLLNTPAGQIAQQIVLDGGSMGISSRGLGSTRQQGDITLVEDDFQLICFDLVSEASTPGAYLMKEGKERDLFCKADRINRALNDILVGRKK
tara:strand:+ start:2123 stop:2704 length:582 start_codon:yes stop_codon:yes gene_type:complete